MRTVIPRAICLFSIVVTLAASAQAAIIGVNFTGGSFGGSPVISLLTTDLAGVIPSGNFNNIVSANNATPVALVDDSGLATTMTLTIAGAAGPYSTIAGAGINPQGADEKLNTGFLAGNGTIALSNIPYASYSIYVYALNDNESRIQGITVNGVTYYQDPPNAASRVDQNGATPYPYIRAIGTTSGTATNDANYMLFTGLSGTSQTIVANAPGNGYITGFQVVQTPEPGSALMALLGGVALLGRRRRRA